ncbi:MAG: ParB/RepB/Spo0J family partition protein [Pseudomonadota bacterium]
MAGKKRGLGRGLDALLGASNSTADIPAESDAQNTADKSSSLRELRDVPVDLIRRGKYQPRRDMDPDALQELADSIKAQGVMQPIVLRPIENDRFEIIAGERRWRATQLAGLDVIPAQVKDVPDDAAIAMALIENIQREDLNPIEEAMALQRLQQEFELTQQQVAEAVGKSRSAVTNLLRLMSLRDEVRTMLEHGDIEMGHGKALLGLDADEQSNAARTVVSKGLSVRQTESLVRQLNLAKSKPSKKSAASDPNVRKLQDELSEKLGTRVQIQHTASGKGKLVLPFSSLDQLDGILGHIK